MLNMWTSKEVVLCCVDVFSLGTFERLASTVCTLARTVQCHSVPLSAALHQPTASVRRVHER